MALVNEDYRDLMNAVHRKDLDAFKRELSKIKNCENYHPKHCLYAKTQDNCVHLIAQLGLVDFLLELIKISGSDLLQVGNVDGKTPLHDAAQFSQFGVSKILLDNGVKVDPLKRADWTPLMLACTKTGEESRQVIQLLISRGANLQCRNKDGWTPFHLAAREGDEAILKLLLETNPELMMTTSNNGRTPLHTACLQGQISAVKIMKNSAALLRSKDSCGAIPILEAVRGGHALIVDLMIEADPSTIYEADVMKRNALHVAAHSGHVEIVQTLVNKHGMNPNDSSKTSSPLHWAAKEGQLQTVLALIELGSNPGALDACQRSPLALAIGGQHVETARALMKYDRLAPFDVTLLPLAHSEAMRKMLMETFQSLWDITLFLPSPFPHSDAPEH